MILLVSSLIAITSGQGSGEIPSGLVGNPVPFDDEHIFPSEEKFNAYFAFKIEDPEIVRMSKELHKIASNISEEVGAKYVKLPNKYELRVLDFNVEEGDWRRASEIIDSKVIQQLCKILPARLSFANVSTDFVDFTGGTNLLKERVGVFAQTESNDWISKVYKNIESATNNHGHWGKVPEDKAVKVFEVPRTISMLSDLTILDLQSDDPSHIPNVLKTISFPAAFLSLFHPINRDPSTLAQVTPGNAAIEHLYLCRAAANAEQEKDNEFCDVISKFDFNDCPRKNP